VEVELESLPGIDRVSAGADVGILTTKPLSFQIAEYIENEIVAGRLQPGTQLIEADLAARLGSSRGPLREALRTVAGKGFVEIVPRKGVFVRKHSAKEIDDTYHVRGALERLAVETAIPKLKPEDVDDFTSLMERMRKARSDMDVKAYFEINLDLHSKLFIVAENTVLTEAYDRLSNPLIGLRLTSLSLPGSLDESYAEHTKIIDAVIKGDVKAATDGIYVHMARAREKLKHYVANAP
jgi:DNA-binding GntR family transcriptional regulator